MHMVEENREGVACAGRVQRWGEEEKEEEEEEKERKGEEGMKKVGGVLVVCAGEMGSDAG